jgi:hypothetical protein
MDLVPVLSTVILVSTLVTLVLGVVSYVAFRMRDRRGPKTVKKGASVPKKTYFVPYRLAEREPPAEAT